MSTSLRYDPWSAHRELLNEFSRFFNERAGNSNGANGDEADWAPPVDIEEYSDKFVISADVPGVEPKSIEITLEAGVLTLSGTRERSVEQAGVESRRIERASGRFFRRSALPDTADAEAVSAKGSNGVIEVIIPKRPAALPRRISVTQ
jgi:HSP20 family protein